MRRRSGLWRLAAPFALLLTLDAAVSAQTAEVHFRATTAQPNVFEDKRLLPSTTDTLRGSLPVLFVHGHNLVDRHERVFKNYKMNWQDATLGGLPSFMNALDLTENQGLGIEDYYIRFDEQEVSIASDAAEISDAVELILHRHDPNYAYPHHSSQTTDVRVVIIAYSKGTISTRLYLKNLEAEHRNYRPVSEFIAIAPPNHGLNDAPGGNIASQQLMNGSDGACHSFGNSSFDFIATLNGHPITDTQSLGNCEFYPPEAPDSRSATTPLANGILYVTLFAAPNSNNVGDLVGGATVSNDCQGQGGRKLALNLSPDAVNIPVAGISGNSELTIHANTVHTPEVMCLALYAATRHHSPKGQTCVFVGNDRIPIIPEAPRAAAMLTLDFSGSMSSLACSTCTRSRADELKSAVQLFVNLFHEFENGTDRLGVTYFRTQIDPFEIAGNRMPSLSTGGNDIVADVMRDTQTPHDNTAMGGGLQSAIAALQVVPNKTRHVILFTDGMQNLNPMVQRFTPPPPDPPWPPFPECLLIDNEPNRTGSNVSPTSPPTVLGHSLGLVVDTIGIGADPGFTGLLQDIAANTGGVSQLTTNANDLTAFFHDQLVTTLQGSSPQLVAYRHGVVSSKGSIEEFTIEDGPRKLVLDVSWKTGSALDFTVAKDGIDVTSAGRIVNGAFHKIFAIDFPAKGIPARGNWQLRIKGDTGTAYESAAIIDSERISYDARFSVQRPRVGDPVDLVVRLTADGRPIGRGANVKVILKSPKTTVGDIIANSKLKELPTVESGADPGQRQILALSQDPSSWEKLQPRTQKVAIKPNDKGEFRKQFQPKIPGVYTAVITIEGEDPKLGKYSRRLIATTVVNFANARLKDRDVSLSETSGGGLRNISVILAPRDKDGHYMGPGLSSNISLVSAGRKSSSIQDLGDGRYLLRLAVPPGDDPIIKLDVAGGTLFNGRLSKLSRQ